MGIVVWPCRIKSYISVYADYKDKGFAIWGVVGERDNAMHQAISNDGYERQNLLELSDANNIWRK